MESQNQDVLPNEDSERIFQERIIPRLQRAGAAAQARAWLLGGQPGAGKSSLAGKNSPIEQGVQISKDLFRVEHPDWLQLLAEDHETASSRTARDATKWLFKSIDWLVGKKHNIVIDGTLRNPAHADELVSILREARYHIKVHFVATPWAISLMSVVERYWKNSRDTGFPFRVCRRSIYEAGCEGVLATAACMDQQTILVDALHVHCRRSEEEIYSRDASLPHLSSGAAQAIRNEQRRLWTPRETEEFLDRYCSLRSSLVERDEKWTQWFDDIARLARPIMPLRFNFPDEVQVA
ncbi:zeta toxin family protein [Streptomyces sp. NPDC055506]